MIDSTVKKIITKHLDNEASNDELEYLYKWLQEEQNQEIFKDFIKTDYLLTLKYNSFDSEEAYSNFLTDIGKKGKIRFFHRNYNFRTWLKYAAIFVGIILISTFLVKRNRIKKTLIDPNEISLQIHNRSEEVFYLEDIDVIIKKNGSKIGRVSTGRLILQEREDKMNNKIYFNELRVPYGKRFEVILGDGTHIYLNSGSELKYPSYFSANSSREVYLKGEAYFEVFKDENRPFIVITDELNTKVLGTKFNVSAYSNTEATEVVLVEGLVGIKVNEEKINDYLILNPSQKGYKLKKEENILIEDVSVAKYISWKDGVLMFENESTENIFKVLERRYNVIIQNNYTGLNNHYFTGTFEHESIEEILNTIKNHTPFNYTKNGEEIIINKN